jgi:hypothetical protein
MIYNINDLTKDGVLHFFKINTEESRPFFDKSLTNLTFWQFYHIYDKCLKDTNLGVFINENNEFVNIDGGISLTENWFYENIKEFKEHVEMLAKDENKSLLIISCISYVNSKKSFLLRGKLIENYKDYDCEEFRKHFQDRRKRVIGNLLNSD